MQAEVNRAVASEVAGYLRHYAQLLAEIKGGVLDCADALERGQVTRSLRRRLAQVDRGMASLYVPDQPLSHLVDLVAPH